MHTPSCPSTPASHHHLAPCAAAELLQLAARVLTAMSKHDELVADAASLDSAQEKLDDILNSPSLGEACGKIDELAARQQLDSTLMLLITKAWAAAKESTMMKEEVKDVMYHLYMNARGNMQRLVPVEVRIMRHLLTIEDPREQRAEMANAFSAGDEVEGQNEDSLFTYGSTRGGGLTGNSILKAVVWVVVLAQDAASSSQVGVHRARRLLCQQGGHSHQGGTEAHEPRYYRASSLPQGST